MCGIAAQFSYRGDNADRQALAGMQRCMQCRGPDGDGQWISSDGRAGLAHQRLSIIDLSPRGAQPMQSGRTDAVVSFNGEIYNYRALRRELEAEGYTFASDSDTEVLLHLYDARGPTFVSALRGMFAFALYDPDRKGMLLARDPYGIKPLYVADTGRTLWAASQVKALRQIAGVDTTADAAGRVGYFLYGHVPEPHTWYRGIRPVPAGHTLWVDADGPEQAHAYADIGATIAQAENGIALPDASPLKQLREALTETVRHHLIADVDVGLFLSAGLDSATLAGLASEETEQLRTLTLGFNAFEGTARDEVPLAEAIASHYDTDHTTVWVSEADFKEAREDILHHMDQPTIDGVNTYFVSRAAAQAGLKVALSGVGGDELFGGYASFQNIPRLVQTLGRVPAGQTLGRGLRAVSAPVLRRFTSPKYAGLLEYGGDYGGAYLLSRSLMMPYELPELLDPDMVRAGWQELQPRVRLNEAVQGIETPELKVGLLQSIQYLRNQLLRDTDWASMAHSLEVRTPLVDQTLLQQVAPLRARFPEINKQAMARTPQTPLPSAVLERPKTGFGIPVRQWLLEDLPDYNKRGLRGWAQYVADRYAT